MEKYFCSSKEHKIKVEAFFFCQKCEISLCKKCDNIHSNICPNHKTFIIRNDLGKIFSGLCEEEGHINELDFFCENHNQLCCLSCIANIKDEKLGKHKDCKIYKIEDIKDKKEKKINKNIKLLEELSKTVNDSIEKIKKIMATIDEKKENLKSKIQKIFTKIRNELNNREEELLKEIDTKFDNYYFTTDILKIAEKLPERIKLSLEKSNCLTKDNNNYKLNSMINDCIKIENNIEAINIINEDIKKYGKNFDTTKIKLFPEDEEIDKLIKNIEDFGNLIVLNSTIIDLEKISIILNWIKIKTNKTVNFLELIFKMSDDGSTGEDFHKSCDRKGHTLILIRTKNQKIFGGFTPLEWDIKKEGYLPDESNQTFIFSLNTMKKFDMIDSKGRAIYNGKKGPFFGNCDIGINEDMKEGTIFANKNCNFFSDNNLELFEEKGEKIVFDVEEIEVFNVKF